jgi:intracellular septation protein
LKRWKAEMKKFLFDLFPLILFFIAYRYGNDIYLATKVAIIVSVLQFVWLRLRRKPIEIMDWIGLGVIVIFCGATIWLKSDIFIKWKPTVLYWIFGGVLLSTRVFIGRNLMRRLMGDKVELPEPAWELLNISWALFFLMAGLINLCVAFSGHFTQMQWVDFKTFGLMGLMIVFVIGQSIWLSKHIQTRKNDENDRI